MRLFAWRALGRCRNRFFSALLVAFLWGAAGARVGCSQGCERPRTRPHPCSAAHGAAHGDGDAAARALLDLHKPRLRAARQLPDPPHTQDLHEGRVAGLLVAALGGLRGGLRGGVLRVRGGLGRGGRGHEGGSGPGSGELVLLEERRGLLRAPRADAHRALEEPLLHAGRGKGLAAGGRRRGVDEGDAPLGRGLLPLRERLEDPEAVYAARPRARALAAAGRAEGASVGEVARLGPLGVPTLVDEAVFPAPAVLGAVGVRVDELHQVLVDEKILSLSPFISSPISSTTTPSSVSTESAEGIPSLRAAAWGRARGVRSCGSSLVPWPLRI
mmetsp:Transcript_45776/g.111444  ORF Transcript_45776/g.111444 Transcript_45776/m.111444 type:complete len:329 (+) Transcript_45776:2-988(+)